MRILFTVLLITLTACAPRGEIELVTSPTAGANLETILIATTRQAKPNGIDFTELRTSQLTYGRYVVSVPPSHKAGRIEWPRNVPNPQRDFTTLDVDTYHSAQKFRQQLNETRAKSQAPDQVVVYIHGFNNSFAEALYRFTQIAADMELQGSQVLYAWPSAESSAQYLHDRDSVLFARDGLQTTLESIVQSGTKRIVLVAHSVGSVLLMETLRQMQFQDSPINEKIEAVFLLSPDIDENLFELQLRSLKPIPRPFIIFGGGDDVALSLSSLITGRRNRVGQLNNKELFKKYDLIPIDLSGFDDGQDVLNHTVAITSPSVIKILKHLPAAVELTRQSSPRQLTANETIRQVFSQKKRAK